MLDDLSPTLLIITFKDNNLYTLSTACYRTAPTAAACLSCDDLLVETSLGYIIQFYTITMHLCGVIPSLIYDACCVIGMP